MVLRPRTTEGSIVNHNRTHTVGGVDEIPIEELRNYGSVDDRISKTEQEVADRTKVFLHHDEPEELDTAALWFEII